MTLAHKVTGYSRKTERLERQFDLPAAYLDTLRRLADVPNEDEDVVGCYPLINGSVWKVGNMLGQALSIDLYDWFLEPSEN